MLCAHYTLQGRGLRLAASTTRAHKVEPTTHLLCSSLLRVLSCCTCPFSSARTSVAPSRLPHCCSTHKASCVQKQSDFGAAVHKAPEAQGILQDPVVVMNFALCGKDLIDELHMCVLSMTELSCGAYDSGVTVKGVHRHTCRSSGTASLCYSLFGQVGQWH
jgi:hypothetical protein